MTIKELPQNLCITLKRFNLDFMTMMTEKLDDRIEFPRELDMKPYTAEFLRKDVVSEVDQNSDQKTELKQSSDEMKDDEEKVAFRSDEYYKYILKGVIIHEGTASGGHYYSYIQERIPGDIRAGKWYMFNDRQVEEWNVEEMAE